MCAGGLAERIIEAVGVDLHEGEFGIPRAFADLHPGDLATVTIGGPPQDPVRVDGHLFDALGHSIAWAAVEAETIAWPRASLEDHTYSLLFGGYSLTLPQPGIYEFSVQPTDSERSTKLRREVRHDGTIDLVLPGGRITGRALDAEGRPMAGTSVSLEPESSTRNRVEFTDWTFASTDETGKYEFTRISAGRYIVRLDRQVNEPLKSSEFEPSWAARGVELRTNSDWIAGVDLHLPSLSSRVEGTLVDPDGKPLSCLIVGRLVSADNQAWFVVGQTDKEGRLHSYAMPPGEFMVHCQLNPLALPHDLRLALAANETTHVEWRAVPATRVIVSVETRDHLPVAFRLEAFHSSEVLLPWISGETMAWKPNIQHWIGPLAPGRYLLRATSIAGAQAEQSITVTGERERRVTLQVAE
jgi:hypothetical protein